MDYREEYERWLAADTFKGRKVVKKVDYKDGDE